MFYQVKSYLQFLLKSSSKHGVHSPFVYHFTEHCLSYKIGLQNAEFKNYNIYKSELLKNHSKINILDFGAGSKYFKDNNRKISDIAKYAGISSVKAKLLIKIVDYFKPPKVLELGTSLGISTSILSRHNQSKVITIEGCSKTLNIAKEYLKFYGLNSISFYNDKFDNILPKITANHRFDLIYFDGNHQKNATLKYFKACLNTINNNSIFIFDDIHLSKNMQDCWQEIIRHPTVIVSIDAFYYGILFFRTEQPKQHFFIRTKS